jgi:hypothetical protein
MAELWTPSMFQKLFELVAKSDKGVLGAMRNRQRSVSLGEFIAFMKANSYQTLGLKLSDLTDAFKFANSITKGIAGRVRLQDADESRAQPELNRAALEDKSEMSEEEFWQCLMFVQARHAALRSDPFVPVHSTRAAFDYNHSGLQQIGRFMQDLCGKAICVRLGGALQSSKSAGSPKDAAAQPASKSRRRMSPESEGEKRIDASAPLTEMEKKRV